VRVENDAFLGAYGELRHGAGRGSSDFVFVKASNGIGACPVINGSPYHGATGIAGEIGHTHVPGRTELCRCGQRGCLEAVVSIETVRRSIAHAHPGMDVDGVALAALDDPMTRRILDEAGRTLGRVLADVCNVLNPASIVLGGDLGTGGPPLLEGVQSSVRRYATPAVAAATQVLPATLGTRAELIGAVALAASLASRPAR
jgi:predicted NBD/HSP70 family sugar kinase